MKGRDASIHSNLTIYALNGWSDVNMSAYVAYIDGDNNYNTMHCQNDSCVISVEAWNCMDIDNGCSDDFEFVFTSTTFESTLQTEFGDEAVLVISGAVVIVLILVAICLICFCTQYRRKQQNEAKAHKQQESNKLKVYGDECMDDTLYVDGDFNETTQLTLQDLDERDADKGFVEIQKQNSTLSKQDSLSF
eukprot:CAMPEP_0197037630 /NCGR_PEP_ID=MMETSP1384-20130603/14787_1 /TAXON_ID=29189 /ORGANISM="Ammonia sp." /LENGTH=190 /DNA_ID=CAMNT_0042467955 /DNA_START=534 /DNA_END=1106 /DNA_ORIENTATION=-